MIPLVCRSQSDAERPFVTRLRSDGEHARPGDAVLLQHDGAGGVYVGANCLLSVEGVDPAVLDGDVVLVDPRRGRAERLIRADSTHNTLLVTERCDQLCLMCSQPPKKTHDDRFDLLEDACLLAPAGTLIGISGGEAGTRVELRTVVIGDNVDALPELSRFVAARQRFVEAWSIMQLERIGFAKGRWADLFVDHRDRFGPVAAALEQALLHGVRAQLFNFPRCTVPRAYRHLAIASISDWKRKYAAGCGGCTQRGLCSGFFEWHPDEEASMVVSPL